MVKLAVLGGVGEVGGNKVMLEEDGQVIFLDFGTSYGWRGQFYEEYMNPRSPFGLLDFLEMELLPPLEGLYRQDMHPDPARPDALWEQYRGRTAYYDLRPLEVRGILCSHGHLDHAGYISFLREDVPVCTTLMSALVMKAIQDATSTDIEQEVVYAIPRERDAKSGLLKAADYRSVPARQRPFVAFDGEVTEAVAGFWRNTPVARGLEARPLRPAQGAVRLGPFTVRCFPVDHSIPGAAGYLVEVGGLAIGYTGDLRFHGTGGATSRAFAAALREVARRRPLVLLCEGTRAGDDTSPPVSEEDVAARALQFMRDARGLIIADFGPRNLERLVIFHRLARELGRQLVITAKDAYLLDAARLADPGLPVIGQEFQVLVYRQPKADLHKWEKAVYERYEGSLVTPEGVHRRQDELVLCFSYFDLKDLPSIRPRPGSLYLYSSHEAFNEEVQMDFRRLRAWLDHFRMRYVGLPREELGWQVPEEERGLHASGHAPARDLLAFVQEVEPAVLVPLHTQRPLWFAQELRDGPVRVELPEYGVALALDALAASASR